MNPVDEVVADTTPLNYLILIRQAEILASLFHQVLIPEAVLIELRHPKAPEAVSQWLESPPPWLVVTPVQSIDETVQLGHGENEAISLAIEQRVPIILMDERRGRAAAESRGILAVGTLNLIDIADEQSLLDGIQALHDLKQTTFRADTELLERFEAKISARRDGSQIKDH